ncbi:Mediator of RNA polymerase II transcription subunit 1 [Bagarius yarrelli]|uniref:Mediator of RNA polymerase II transcription subunit 1 n=1 Tax=Bagarius yarrelli TaxID=175774 RepID=A0A556TJM3_BAGYA|nr:Mediator of RNA polymerase II transcription subunit 1 [Bagarius yarrelli]
MGSHLSPTETACYLTADLFYVEVLLLPGGEVEDVKVAQHGKAPEVESMQMSYKNSDSKMKVYTSLQHMQQDLVKISNLPRHLIESDKRVDMILNGRIGSITPSQEGTPMSIEYYISPSDALIERLHSDEGSRSQTAVVVVGASATTHKLQKESLIPTPPQVDSEGLPVFIPLSETCSELLPAFFVLKIKPAVPMLNSFIHKISQITDIPPDADLQGEPLFQLLEFSALKDKKTNHGKDTHCIVSLPDAEFHRYLFANAEWKHDFWKASLIHTVPFTHPTHVPALLELLRYQSAINTLLASCITSLNHQPVLVTVMDCRQLCCRLFMPGPVDHSLDDYISRVLTRCMSIPITLRALRKRISILRPPALPLEPDFAGKAEIPSSTLAQCAVENTPAVVPSATLSPEPMEEVELPAKPGHYVMSVAAASAVDGTNTDAIANHSPCASVGVYSPWVASSFPAELV